MRITRKKFLLITLMFLLLPISANYRLIFFGSKTTGIVVEQKHALNNTKNTYSIIHFVADGRTIDFIGPEDVEYPVGKEVTIYFNPRNPQKFIMFNFAGLVLNNKMIIPGVLLIMWFAFYLAVRDSQSREPKPSNLFRYMKAIDKNK